MTSKITVSVSLPGSTSVSSPPKTETISAIDYKKSLDSNNAS